MIRSICFLTVSSSQLSQVPFVTYVPVLDALPSRTQVFIFCLSGDLVPILSKLSVRDVKVALAELPHVFLELEHLLLDQDVNWAIFAIWAWIFFSVAGAGLGMRTPLVATALDKALLTFDFDLGPPRLKCELLTTRMIRVFKIEGHQTRRG